MSTNKHALIRFRILDQCFRNIGKKYFIEDLVEACSIAVNNYAGIESGISKRQVQDDIKFMESAAGYAIELDKKRDGKRVYFRYRDSKFSISAQPLNEYEAIQLKASLLTLTRFRGLPQFEWVGEMIARLESSFNLRSQESSVVEFDQNPFLKGMEHIGPLYYAIIEKRVMAIDYKGVKTETVSKYEFSPHYLKQYNSRWFLFGIIKGRDDVTNFPLDRIIELKQAESDYDLPTVNYYEYFDDVVGVTIINGQAMEVILQVKNSLLPYIKSKPLHGSQKIKQVEGKNFLELFLEPNYELESLILSHGEGLKVLEPIDFKNKIESRIRKMLE